MEPLLSGDKLSQELEFAKRQIDALGTLKLEHANDYTLPEEHRPKRATIANVSLAIQITPELSCPAPLKNGMLTLCWLTACRSE